MCKPSPVPWILVALAPLKKLENRCAWSSTPMPIPWSFTSMTAFPFSVFDEMCIFCPSSRKLKGVADQVDNDIFLKAFYRNSNGDSLVRLFYMLPFFHKGAHFCNDINNEFLQVEFAYMTRHFSFVQFSQR
jgi:hypothetical protein